jgi:MoxR-like ATPase
MTDMTKGERTELVKIVRQRAKLAKDDIEARKRQILADAEATLSAEFKEQDEAWAEITAEAREYMAEAQAKIAAKCDEKGIPVDFRPTTGMYWLRRGRNADPERRGELRKAVQAQAEASARQAKLEIDRRSVGLQEQIMVGGFESDEARQFLESLPTAEALMPSLKLPQLGS